MNYLADTNILIALFNKDMEIYNKIQKYGKIYISVVSLGELYLGAYYSQKINENLSKIKEHVSNCFIVHDLNDKTANFYGIIKANQKRIGKPIPDNDIWITATAMEHDLILISRDKHVLETTLIKTEKW